MQTACGETTVWDYNTGFSCCQETVQTTGAQWKAK